MGLFGRKEQLRIEEFNGIEPIKAFSYDDPNKEMAGTTFEFSGNKVKICSQNLPLTQKREIMAWMVVKPKSGEPTQTVHLVAENDINPGQPLILSFELAKEGGAEIYFNLSGQKRCLTGIRVPSYLMRGKPFSR